MMLEYLDAGFQYNFRSLRETDRLFSKLSYRLKKKLVFHLIGRYREKFPFFFDDFEKRYKSGEDFQYEILSNMECLILPRHEGHLGQLSGEAASAIVMDHDASVQYLYFVHIGAVEVYDKENRILATYPSGSFFSDF